MSSSLLLQQCPTCLVHLTWIVFVMGDRWPYSCCFEECCLQVLFSITQSTCVVAVKLFIHVVHPYSSIDMTAAWKKLHFISLVRSDSQSIAVHAFASHMLMSVLVDETLLPR